MGCGVSGFVGSTRFGVCDAMGCDVSGFVGSTRLGVCDVMGCGVSNMGVCMSVEGVGRLRGTIGVLGVVASKSVAVF